MQPLAIFARGPAMSSGPTARRALRWLTAFGLSCLALSLFALSPDRPADSYSLRGWLSERGLPSNKVRDVVQTRDGYLWLATAQGLARFDGSNFTTYSGNNVPALRGGGFYALLEDADGSLWCGGDNGLFRYRGGRFERFTTEQGLAHNYVRALGRTRDGTVVACTRTGFSFVRGDRIESPGAAWKDVTGVARAYLERGDGTRWLATDDGLWRVTGDQVERLSGKADFPGTTFVDLLETTDGSLWIGYNQGLRRIHPDGRTEHFSSTPAGQALRVAALHADRAGNLWIGTYGSGLYRFANGRLEAASYSEDLDHIIVQGLTEDREGGLWLATVMGLFRLTDNPCRAIGPESGLVQATMFPVFASSDDAWWLGIWGGGAYRYSNQRATRLDVPASLGLERVLAFTEEPAGTLWIGAWSGLYRHAAGETVNLYDRDRAAGWQRQFSEDPLATFPGIAHPRVNSVAPDGTGGLWVATDGALYHGRAGGFRAFNSRNGPPGDTFKSVLRARDGSVWATVPPVGVVRWFENRWTTFRCGEAIADIYPRAVFEDRDGVIWVTSEGGGLNRFANGKWRTFTVRDGLADDFISAMVEDAEGNFWIGSPRGLMRIPRAQFAEFDSGKRTRFDLRLFDRSDGMPTQEINQQGSPAACRTRDGHLLFATDRGAVVVDPQRIRVNPLPPTLHIERLVVNNVDADLAQVIVVPPGRNDVQVHYTGISLLAPDQVRFRIRLAPLDADWVDTGGRRDVRYAKLPPGDYVFSVNACNTDGVWNQDAAAVRFRVEPFFYQTTWFLALSVVVVLATLWTIYRVRLRMAKRRLAELEAQVEARTQELRRANEAAAREFARFKFIFESVPVGISWVVLGEESTRLVNPAHRRITGLTAGDAGTDEALARVTPPDDLARERELAARLRRGEIPHFSLEKRFRHEGDRLTWALLTSHLFTDPATGQKQWVSTLADVTERKTAEAELARANQQLLEVSRMAGMAEVASNVLHNVGNVLNSLNVSASVVAETLRTSKSGNLDRLVELLQSHEGKLGEYFTNDPKSRLVPGFLKSLADCLRDEHRIMKGEIADLGRNVEHIREIVAMQQGYARVAGVADPHAVVDLVEEALQMNAASFARHDVALGREFEATPTITIEKHKVLQILVNLLRNAKQACTESGRPDRKITIRVAATAGGGASIAVHDTGIGIPAENLTRIFAHGFTTKKTGNGFGLHSAANVARELGGQLVAQSDGPGHGATFILELPPVPPARAG